MTAQRIRFAIQTPIEGATFDALARHWQATSIGSAPRRGSHADIPLSFACFQLSAFSSKLRDG
jgi:hypothetical protein